MVFRAAILGSAVEHHRHARCDAAVDETDRCALLLVRGRMRVDSCDCGCLIVRVVRSTVTAASASTAATTAASARVLTGAGDISCLFLRGIRR